MIFSVLRVYHLYSCVFIFTAFVSCIQFQLPHKKTRDYHFMSLWKWSISNVIQCVERLLATIWLEDYENRRNPTASIIILATVFLVSVALGMDTTYGWWLYLFHRLITFTSSRPRDIHTSKDHFHRNSNSRIASCALKQNCIKIRIWFQASIILHKHNLNHIKVMDRQIHRYKLSTRFQIVENCRAFEVGVGDGWTINEHVLVTPQCRHSGHYWNMPRSYRIILFSLSPGWSVSCEHRTYLLTYNINIVVRGPLLLEWCLIHWMQCKFLLRKGNDTD